MSSYNLIKELDEIDQLYLESATISPNNYSIYIQPNKQSNIKFIDGPCEAIPKNLNIEYLQQIQYEYTNIQREMQNSKLENIWFQIKKDCDYYNLCQKANVFHFTQLVEK
jgi:hypothetical protein